MNFISGKELIALCQEKNIKISEAMLKRELRIKEVSKKEVLEKLQHSWDIMKASTKKAIEEERRSMGGLLGGEEKKIITRLEKGENICGTLMTKAVAYAMGVMEINASMGLIVAAPTAGSAGIIPGVLTAIQEEKRFGEEQMLNALLNAGAVGYLVTKNATVAGAEGGCQAEVGTASAMAASAITELFGGTPEDCLHSASTALANILGLVCDPVAGLVEEPCQKRNAMGVSNAFISTELTLAGIKNLIPFDEMVDVMYRVGTSLPFELRETALGGIAAAPSACLKCKYID